MSLLNSYETQKIKKKTTVRSNAGWVPNKLFSWGGSSYFTDHVKANEDKGGVVGALFFYLHEGIKQLTTLCYSPCTGVDKVVP